jgi:ABC-type branched-subunit amino acid transport system ATPase component
MDREKKPGAERGELMEKENNELLRTENLTKDFGKLRAVDNLSLSLEKGEIRGLIGPNGSGKTTVVNLITGVYRPTSGGVYFSGRRIDRLSPDNITHEGIMRTFQVARVFADMTVLENMLIPAFTQRTSRREARHRAQELLDFCLLGKLSNEPARNLSGGQTMLLQIVRGFMRQPLKLYLLDEPFAGVHPAIKDVIIETIQKMNREEDVTFLIVSHELTTVRRLCSRISVLHGGRVISEGTMKEVANDPRVIDSYLGG